MSHQQNLTWDEIDMVLDTGVHCILYGPPGTGKTRIGNRTAGGKETYNITLTAETPAAELRGHFVPKGHQFEWHDGPAIRAWREGCPLVLNEINEASGDALVFLLALLDDPEMAKITLPSGETVRPAPGFQCISTTNVMKLEDSLSEALLDRFAVRILVDYPAEAAFARLDKDIRDFARKTVSLQGDRKISLRQWLAFCKLRKGKCKDATAIKAIFNLRADDVRTAITLKAEI